jgi:hypothetical protein
MKSVLPLLASLLLAGAASAQVLSEDFSSGVPPAGWTHVNNNGSSTQGWIPGTIDSVGDHTGWAWHEDETSSLGTADNTLLSPLLDLSGVSGSVLTFDGETNYAVYLANHPQSVGDGRSTMEVTTDGGLTWTVVWRDTSASDGTYSTCADLSAFDGQVGVQLGVHFYGTYAQEWWVDNIVIDGGGCAPVTLAITALVRGNPATLTLTGATPNGHVLIGYTFTGPGPLWTPYGMADMNGPIQLLPVQVADASGSVVITAGVASRVLPHTLYAQAYDFSSGRASNSIAEPVL